MSVDLHSATQRVERLFGYRHLLPQDNFRLLSEWAQYLTVVTSGYLENALRIIFHTHIEEGNSPVALGYAEGQRRKMPNPTPETILELVNSFDNDVGQQLEEYWDGGKRAAISSIVKNRNKIAHGEDAPDVTMGRIMEYYSHVKDVIDFLDQRIRGLHT